MPVPGAKGAAVTEDATTAAAISELRATCTED